MRTNKFMRLVTILFLGAILAGYPAEAKQHALIEKTLPELPASLSGYAICETNGGLAVVGGVDQTTGKFSETVFFLKDGAGKWERFEQNGPFADAAVVSGVDGIYVIGGRTPAGPVTCAFRLVLADGHLRREPLPDLPWPLVSAGAGILGDQLYVVGGDNGAGGKPERNFLSLDVKNGNSWQILPDCPAGDLLNPIVATQTDAFIVFGGECVGAQAGKPIRDSWLYRQKAQDAMRRKGWINIADMPISWKPTAALPIGQSHVVLLGVDTGANQLAAYHVVTDAWSEPYTWSESIVAQKAVNWGADKIAVLGVAREPGQQQMPVLQAEFPHVTEKLAGFDYVVIGLYLALMLGVGAYFSTKEKTTKDFFLGGRKIPWWAAGFSLYATGTSAISFMAIPAKTWTSSTLYGVEGLVGLLGLVASAYLVIPIIRKLDITSVYQYLERRFNPWLRLWGSALNIAFQLSGRMSVVLLLPSLAISAVTGLPVMWIICISGVIATIYTVMGGISAVIWTDVAQVVVLLGGALLAFLLMILGSDGSYSGWVTMNLSYDKFRAFEWSFDFTQPVIWIMLLGTLIGIGTAASDQVMIQRVLATPSVKAARRSYLTLGLIVLPGGLLFCFLGTAMFSYFHSHPNLLNPTMSDIDVLPLFIVAGLPAGLSGLIIAGLMAATMSTLDSSMNSVSTLFVTDFYRRFKRDASDHQCLVLGKWLTVFVGVFGTGAAMLMATFEIKSMFDMWSQFCSLFMGGFGGVFILGMFTRRANGWGALVGAVASIGATLAVQHYTSLHFYAYGSVAIISCVVVGYFASLLIPHPKVDLTGLTIFTPGRDETLEAEPKTA